MGKPTDYTTTITIPFPADDEIRRAMGEGYKPDVLNVTKMLAGTGDCFAPVVALVKALFQGDDIDARLREVVTLRAAVLLNAPYEWQQNSKMALNTGLSQNQIDAVAGSGPVRGLADSYVLGCAAVDELIGSGTLTDDTLASLIEEHGEGGTRRLILAIGYFALLGMFLNGCRVPLETKDKIGTSTSPLGG